MNIKLPEKSHRWYCVPFAVSALTGLDFEETRAVINRARSLPSNSGIRGVSTDNMERALRMAGITMKVKLVQHSKYQEKRTLNSWLKELKKDDDRVYVVELTSHIVLVQGRTWFIDNHTSHPVNAFTAPWQRKLVKKVWSVD